MKVYQIHEYGGSYGDFTDYVVGTFLSESKAREHMKYLESNVANMVTKHNMCAECNYDKPCFIDDGEDYCENYFFYDESTYEIKEVEVIE